MKKDLNYYISLPYEIRIVPDTEEGGFTAYYPDLPGCITCGDTLDSVYANALDAKFVWLEAALEDNIDIKEPLSDDQFSGQFSLRIPKRLHRTLSENAQREGISMNQYCLYLLSQHA